ncbi:MAG: hypothetical protein V5A45_11165 [Haloarculaceae archaeon]
MDGLPRGWLVTIALTPLAIAVGESNPRRRSDSRFDPDWDPSRPVGGLSTPHTALVARV